MQVKNGQANIYNGLTVSGSTSLRSSGSTVLSIDGTSGRLFSVDDSLSGSLFSVNTAAGLPVMEAFSDNTVRVGQYGTLALFVSKSRVGIGKESGLNANLDVVGTAIVSGSAVGSPAFYVTNGGVQFGSTTGFVWDASNNRLGIGGSPTYKLDVIDGSYGNSFRVYQSAGDYLVMNGRFLTFAGANTHNNTFYFRMLAALSDFYINSGDTNSYGLSPRFLSSRGLVFKVNSSNEAVATSSLSLYSTSNIGIYNTVDSGYRLDIYGTGAVSGSLRVSGSTAMVGSGSSLLTIDGVSGRLFQVDDSLSGSLFSVNNSTGLPLIEAFSDDTIRMGQFGTRTLFVSQSRVGIGTETPATSLQVLGNLRVGSATRYLDVAADSFFVTITSDNGNNYGVRLPKITLNDSNSQIRYASNGISIGSDFQSNLFVLPNTSVSVFPILSVTGSLNVSGSSVMSGSLNIIGPSSQIATISSTNATATRLAINHTSATPNSGFVLQTNGVNNWSLANYVPSGTNASFVFYNDRTNTDSLFINGDTNNVGIRTNSPTARLDIPASVTSSASLRIRSGSAPTSPNDGDIWFDGTSLYMRIGGVTKTFTMTP